MPQAHGVAVDAQPLVGVVVGARGTYPTSALPALHLLAAMLAEWRLAGWPREFGRAPRSDDLIVPHTKPTNRGRVEFGDMHWVHGHPALHARLRPAAVVSWWR
jgi:hypothetical protein